MRGGSCLLATALLVACGAFTGKENEQPPEPAPVDDAGDASPALDATLDGGGYDPCANHACPLVIFVSSVLYSGNIGGVAQADRECKMLAQNVNLQHWSRFRAYLSDALDTAPSAPIIDLGRSYARIDHVAIGGGSAIVKGNLENAIDVDERGKRVEGTSNQDKYAWTNVTAAGAPLVSSCTGWKTTGGQGSVGTMASTDAGWAATTITQSCSDSFRIYCVEGPED